MPLRHLQTSFKDPTERESFTVKPWKNRKNSRAFSARTRGTSGSNYPPFQGNVQIPPPPWARCTVKCPGHARGDVEASI